MIRRTAVQIRSTVIANYPYASGTKSQMGSGIRFVPADTALKATAGVKTHSVGIISSSVRWTHGNPEVLRLWDDPRRPFLQYILFLTISGTSPCLSFLCRAFAFPFRTEQRDFAPESLRLCRPPSAPESRASLSFCVRGPERRNIQSWGPRLARRVHCVRMSD